MPSTVFLTGPNRLLIGVRDGVPRQGHQLVWAAAEPDVRLGEWET